MFAYLSLAQSDSASLFRLFVKVPKGNRLPFTSGSKLGRGMTAASGHGRVSKGTKTVGLHLVSLSQPPRKLTSRYPPSSAMLVDRSAPTPKTKDTFCTPLPPTPRGWVHPFLSGWTWHSSQVRGHLLRLLRLREHCRAGAGYGAPRLENS